MLGNGCRVPSAMLPRFAAILTFSSIALTGCGGGAGQVAEESSSGRVSTEGMPSGITEAPESGGSDSTDGHSSDAGPTTTRPGGSAASGAPTTFAVVGDSITAGTLPLEGSAVRGANSWIPSASDDARLEFVGGWAAPGATTTEMREATQPIAADVLVLLGGTNDLGTAVTWSVIESDLLSIVATSGTPTVVLSAVPPHDAFPEEVQRLNGHLEDLALRSRYSFVDPWADMSTEGRWIPGTSDDGIHPTEQVAALVGDRLAAAIAAAG
jgi:acyl-CoA thioesterase-1